MKNYSIKNILVPVDLSETSLNAVEKAVALAKKHDALLHLFHVDETLVIPTENNSDSNANFKSDSNAEVLSAIAGAIKHKHNIKPIVTKIEGNVSESIITAGLDLSCDLIV